MKMMSSILLLLILSSCLCAATFVVNVTQSSYQAEEKQNITLEWTFTTKTQGTWRNLFIYCEVNTDHGVLVLYHIHEGVEIPESQDDQFSGRVQSDKDVLREGRIRLHVSRLRTEDSGRYLCDVKTEDGFNSGRCRLNVTDEKKPLISAADQIQTQRPTWTPEPERQEWMNIIIIIINSVGLTAAALIFLLSYFLDKCFLPVDVYFNNDNETRDSSITLLLETV
ncbi:uncharacterized protein LOC129356117 [Poeciliopsis prolifica]|uniref:uncharacterized protein LOC129356117 n=1 Tax=Poeciliopsis prolifica TaxID=188132 RepID=UPI002413D611|nr:uncharacterized protein LOC129356117 [Poeciliopsis prolifica]